MYKALLHLAVLLFVVPSPPVQAQASASKTQSSQNDSKVIAAATEPNPEAKSLYEDGMARLEMGQVSEAVERFQRALKIDPEYAEAYAGLGRAFFKLRQWENAVGPLRRAIALKAKARERQDAVQKNPVRMVEPRLAPTPANKPPASKPPASNNNKPEVKIPGVVSVNVTSDSAPQRLQLPRVEPPASTMSDDLQSPPAAIAAKVEMNVKPLLSTIDEVALTSIYRVGSKDVLDIRLSNSQPQQMTAFTVTSSGLIEHPQLSAPLPVTGLTVDEIRARIEEDLKKQALTENTKVFVGVIEHASHSVVVDGLVKTPGTKMLKSEAIPLAVVVAEAQPLVDAKRVSVVRDGANQILETDLSHTADLSFLVRPGDVVTLRPHVDEFFYIDGKVKRAGEQRYRLGLTLTQAIISAGGATSSKVAEIAREDGELVRTRFDLNAIQSGKVADPLIKPRDRITLH